MDPDILWIGLAMMAGTVMAIAHKRTRAVGWLLVIAATCVYPLVFMDDAPFGIDGR